MAQLSSETMRRMKPKNTPNPKTKAEPNAPYDYHDDVPVYNSRIVKTSMEYLLYAYPDTDVDAIFESAEIKRHQVEDPAHWFTQRHVDAFNEIVVEKTGDPDFSRKAGRHYAKSASLGPMKQYTTGLLSISMVFKAMSRLYPLISKGAILRTIPVSPNCVEVISRPAPGVNEKEYQCKNRTGVFEAVGKFFHDEFNEVKHPECRYRGGKACRYIISWNNPPHNTWRKLRNMSLPAGVIAGGVAFFFLPIAQWLMLLPAMGCVGLFLCYQVAQLENQDLTQIMTRQGLAAEIVMEEDKKRYGSAALSHELGQVISTIHETDRMILEIAHVMQERLSFDRGAFLLADAEGQYLHYRGGYGFTREEVEIIKACPAPVHKPDMDDLIARVFHLKKPMLISSQKGFKRHFSKPHFEVATKLKGKSLISVPVVYEGRSLGVLMVDQIRRRYPMNQSDVSFLTGIASLTAVGLENARSFKKLQESETKYRLLADNLSDVIWIMDLTSLRFIYLSPAVKRMRGFSIEEAMAMSLEETLTPDSMEVAAKVISEELALDHIEGVDPDRSRTMRLEQFCKDGSTMWAEITARFLRDDGGKPIQVLGITRDITDRIEAEKERKRLRARLQRSAKMEALGTLAGGVAHDLNNILAGITGYPELLLMDLPADSPMRKPIQAMHDSGMKAAAIVQDLLTLARRGVSVNEGVDLNAIVSDYLKSPEHHELKETHRGVTFKTLMGESLLKITGSAVHLSKTVMNLVYNAAESIAYEGEVAIETFNRYVDTVEEGYDAIADGEYAVLKISDSGSGIPQNDLEYIFEPFYSKKKMGRSGTGLGMAVVWGTVKDHNGYIDVKSTEGKGSVFTLYFPVSREVEKEDLAAGHDEDLAGNREKILVVDDVRVQREIASSMLSRLNYDVSTAAGGQEALDFLADQKVDLVVLDMIMPPGMDGLDTYRKILETRPHQRAIIASGYSETDRVRKAQELGAGPYVKKPYNLEGIGLAVKKELDRTG